MNFVKTALLNIRLVLVLLGVVFLGSIAYSQLKGSQDFADIINGHDWTHFAGATQTQSGIQISPLNKEIIHQDGSKAQLNPPLNVRGPHLAVSGNFEVKANMDGIEDGASLQFYSQPPVIYDEWRQEHPSIRIDISANSVEARIWDGNSSTPMDIRSFNVNLNGPTKLDLKHEDGQIALAVNSHELGSMPDHNIFAGGTVWFGLDGNDKGDGWILRDLRAHPLGKDSLDVIAVTSLTVDHNDANLLRNLIDKQSRKIQIGVAVSVNPLYTDEAYKNIAMSQFNLVTTESSLKAQFIHPAPDKYNFTEADNIIAMAEANGQAVHGHTLIFAKSNPSWMTDTPEDKLAGVMTDHTTNVVKHFKGRIGSWDVVNEPMSEKDEDYTNGNLGLRQHFWFKAMGEQYIDKAFKAARAADPTAKLYLNDYGIEHDGMRWQAFYTLVQRLQARGAPIDGVGFESHVYQTTDKIDLTILRAHIKAIADLGLSVRISEIDVLGDEPQFQSQQYSDVLAVCLSEPSCSSYTTWGVSDLYGSTTISERYPLLLGDSLLWDKDMQPKSAFFELQKVLKNNQVQ